MICFFYIWLAVFVCTLSLVVWTLWGDADWIDFAAGLAFSLLWPVVVVVVLAIRFVLLVLGRLQRTKSR
jgi:hypothetical protein